MASGGSLRRFHHNEDEPVQLPWWTYAAAGVIGDMERGRRHHRGRKPMGQA
jgi:hypothetical protein